MLDRRGIVRHEEPALLEDGVGPPRGLVIRIGEAREDKPGVRRQWGGANPPQRIRGVGRIELIEGIEKDVDWPLGRGVFQLLVEFLFQQADVGRQLVGQREVFAQPLAKVNQEGTQVG